MNEPPSYEQQTPDDVNGDRFPKRIRLLFTIDAPLRTGSAVIPVNCDNAARPMKAKPQNTNAKGISLQLLMRCCALATSCPQPAT
jgi:hypothetical protein